MTIDPRLIELAREVDRDLNPGRRGSPLRPVLYLVAEFVYLERTPQHVFEFIKRAEIDVTYKAMHKWLGRTFGRGKEAGRKAALVLQRAADTGAYFSPYLPSRRSTAGAKDVPRDSAPTSAQSVILPDGVAVQRQGGAAALARDAVQEPAEGATDSIAFSRERNSVPDPVASNAEPAQPGTWRSSAASVTDAEADAKEAERIRIRDERVRKGRAEARRMLEANPFTRIANRQRMDERSDK